MKTIMMIDDDESAHIYHKLMLETAQISTQTEVISFISSVEALSYLKNIAANKGTIPNLILIDINMPELDGWELIQEMKKMKLIAQTKVYVVSHSEANVDLAKAKAFNIDFKQKFLSPEFFRGVLNGINENI